MLLLPEQVEDAYSIDELGDFLKENGYTDEEAAQVVEQASTDAAAVAFVPYTPTADGQYVVSAQDEMALAQAGVQGVVAGDVVYMTPAPTTAATEEPTEAPTEEPTEVPTDEPTAEPTAIPTDVPTEAPTEEPTLIPTEAPTRAEQLQQRLVLRNSDRADSNRHSALHVEQEA